MNKPQVLVICGPTASGKTKLGIELANIINGEIISCDSMQIYKEMDIGTAKPTKEEQKQAKHHLIDFVEPNKRYSVADYKKDATKIIKEIIERKKQPIIVGGTGLYLDSLIYNIEFQENNIDLKYRAEIEKKNINWLYEQAKKIDEQAVKKISANDRKRIIRILEIYNSTGKTKTELEKESRKKLEYDFKIFILSMDRVKLYERVNTRVDKMLEQGLIKEVEQIYKKYDEFPTAMQGLGYKEVVKYLNGNLTKEEMMEKIKQESRRYAKRQLTWFRRYENAYWLDAEDNNNISKILEEISEKKAQN